MQPKCVALPLKESQTNFDIIFFVMTSTITFTLQFLDLSQSTAREIAQQALSDQRKTVFHQIDGSPLTSSDLLQALNAFENENEADDLSLEELENISGGVGLPEALVSSTILMAMVAGASGMFVNSMDAMSSSRVQDALNAGVNANIEVVRNQLSDYASAGNGIYSVPDGVTSDNLGSSFLNSTDLGNDLDGDASNGITTEESFGGQTVRRHITANGESIQVTYTHDNVDIQSTTMVSPAAGWLS